MATMKMLSAITLLATCVMALAEMKQIVVQPGYVKDSPISTSWRPIEIPTQSPISILRGSDLPTAWDWRNPNGTGHNLCSRVQNQFLPQPCGSCWAFAATTALSDRFRIQAWRNGNAIPDITFAPQVLLDCGSEVNYTSGGLVAGSCNGGSANLAYKWMATHGIVDDTAAPYLGNAFSHWAEMDCADTMARTCDIHGVCKPLPSARRYYAANYGILDVSQLGSNMVSTMMSEIVTRGPLVCSMYAHSDSFENYTGGVIVDRAQYPGTTHDLVLVGFGEENGVPYWIGRNSFGTNWGELGWFRAERGTNIFNMEQTCYWATPRV